MTAFALPQRPPLWVPRFEPWRLLRPLKMGINSGLLRSRLRSSPLLAGQGSSATGILSAAALFTYDGSDTADASPIVLSSQSFGAAPSGGQKRFIAIAVGIYNEGLSTQDRTVTAIDVGGNAATIWGYVANFTSGVYSVVALAEVPTGTSGTITITYSGNGTTNGFAYQSWRIITGGDDLAISGSPSIDFNDDPLSFGVTVPTGGIAFGSAVGANSTTTEWTGDLTEETPVDLLTDDYFIGAALLTPVETPTALTAGFDNGAGPYIGDIPNGVVVAIGPT